MIAVREGRGPWASPQFELQRLIGSGKTSNVYQVQYRSASGIARQFCAERVPRQACCIRSGVVVALKIYPKARSVRPGRIVSAVVCLASWR